MEIKNSNGQINGFLARLLYDLPIFLLQFLFSFCKFPVMYRGILSVPQLGLLELNSLDFGDFCFFVHKLPALGFTVQNIPPHKKFV